jgi:hypothetical protein
MISVPSLRTVARGAVGLAALSGFYGSLRLLGAFGPVGCWTSRTTRGDGTVTTARGCEAGIDYLFGSTGGNAPILFFWAVVLLALVAVGVGAVWTGHRTLGWVVVVVGAAVTVLGLFSVGSFFLVPTLCLFLAVTARTVAARRSPGGGTGPATGG